MTAKGTVWTLKCYFVFYYNLFETCWNWGFWPWDELKLTICTMTHSRHAETNNLDHNVYCDHNIFRGCWNRQFWPWHIPDMRKQTILTMTYSSHADTDNFDHNVFQTCWNLQFWPWHITDMLKLTICTAWQIPDMLKLTIWTRTHSSMLKCSILTMIQGRPGEFIHLAHLLHKCP
jgi:hypothetical protein